MIYSDYIYGFLGNLNSNGFSFLLKINNNDPKSYPWLHRINHPE